MPTPGTETVPELAGETPALHADQNTWRPNKVNFEN